MTASLPARATNAPASEAEEPRRRRRMNPDGAWPWLFVLPLMAGVGLFFIWPIIQTVYFSFTKWGAFGTTINWVGTANYQRMATDPAVANALLNTVGYTAIVLAGIPIAVFFASLINRPGLRFAKLYRVAFFMPFLAMPAAIAMVWRLIYNGDYGMANQILGPVFRLIGVNPPSWLATPGWALVAVGITGLWASLGFNMIILSAGLKNISTELYEAAQLDGASRMRQFRSITIPLLTPSIFFITIITMINGFQLFDLLFAMMGDENPAMPQTRSLVYLFYTKFRIDQGYAAAIAVLILLIIGAMTALQFRMQRKWVHYE